MYSFVSIFFSEITGRYPNKSSLLLKFLNDQWTIFKYCLNKGSFIPSFKEDLYKHVTQ
jgi:hypothetical protein